MDYTKINYSYWREEYEKTINGIKPNARVKSSLDAIKTTILKEYSDDNDNILANLLRKPNLKDRNMSKIKELADEIADEIFDSKSDNNQVKYLSIFDAVNAWGGISARGMYIRKTKIYNNTTRKSWKQWIEVYINAVENISKGKTDEVLQSLTEIEYMGIAFATKHMWYWSDYFLTKRKNVISETKKIQESGLTERYIVFDMRISMLLFYKRPNVKNYSEAQKKLIEIRNDFNLKRKKIGFTKFDISDIEKAIFAFSQFYFSNDIDLWNSGDFKYKKYPKNYSKEVYIEITETRIKQCIKQKKILEKGKDFEIACNIFSNTSPQMHLLMIGEPIIAKENIVNNENKIKKQRTVKENNTRNRKIEVIIINKNECFMHNNDGLYIISSFLDKNKKISSLINIKKFILIKGDLYYKFTGNQNLINIVKP
jgi:hypothetical protein